MNGFFYVRQQRSKDVIVEVIQIGFFTFGPFFSVKWKRTYSPDPVFIHICGVKQLQAGWT